MQEVVYSSEYAVVKYDGDLQAIQTILKKEANLCAIKKIVTEILESFMIYKAGNLIINISNFEGQLIEDCKWIEEKVLPRAVEGGLTRIAIVDPANSTIKHFTNEKIKRMVTPRGTIIIKHFDTLMPCANWFNEPFNFSAQRKP